MKTVYHTNQQGAEAITKGLTEIFGTKEGQSEIEKTYSLGFLRMSKLSKARRLKCFHMLMIEGFGTGIENQNEMKNRLEKMSESEYKEFKKCF